MIQTEKFYLFDVGVANYLARRTPHPGTPAFGKAFEHYILMELRAYQAYKDPELPVAFWRSSTGVEIDFILGDKDVALEVKGKPRVHEGDLASLRAIHNEGVKHRIVVCLETQPRILEEGIEIVPWRNFIDRLWAGDFF